MNAVCAAACPAEAGLIVQRGRKNDKYARSRYHFAIFDLSRRANERQKNAKWHFENAEIARLRAHREGERPKCSTRSGHVAPAFKAVSPRSLIACCLLACYGKRRRWAQLVLGWLFAPSLRAGRRTRRTPRSRRHRDGSRRTRSSTGHDTAARRTSDRPPAPCRLVSAFTRSEMPTAMRCMMLFSDGGRDATIRRAGQVDHVERDDARVRRAGANARDQIFEVGAPLPDLRVDVGC